MRVALILLSIVALMFIGSISWSLLGQGGTLSLKRPPTEPAVDPVTESYWRNQKKLEDKISNLTDLVQEMSKKEHPSPQTQSSGSTGSIVQNVKISGKFLSLIMPTITPTLVENAGIFDLHIFDVNTRYSTYKDDKNALTIVALDIPYDTFLKNILALGSGVYATNETKTYPFRSFYLNPPKSDTLVRLAIESEGQTIALTVPKASFSNMKNMLLGKPLQKSPLQNLNQTPQKKSPTSLTVQTKTGTTTTLQKSSGSLKTP